MQSKIMMSELYRMPIKLWAKIILKLKNLNKYILV